MSENQVVKRGVKPALNKQFFAGAAILAIFTAASALNADAATFDASNIVINDVTADIRVTTNADDAVNVNIRQGSEFASIKVTQDGDTVILQGEGFDEPEGGCCDSRITRVFDARTNRDPNKDSSNNLTNYPTIEIAMPRSGNATFDDVRMKLNMESLSGTLTMDACYVDGEIGDTDEAYIGIVSGSRLSMGDVKATFEADVSGRADLRANDVSAVDVDISGSGAVQLGRIDGMLDASIAGSGRVEAARLTGPLTARIAGSGGVAVASGNADPLKAIIEGSGVVIFDGTASSTDLRLSRSAEVRLRNSRGRIGRVGSGSVYVADKRIESEE
ncbi:MAG: hypothetical protein AAF720_02940 [Pseudomonadota bacterium]